MGWYADSQWDLTFRDEGAVRACAAELRALEHDRGQPPEDDMEMVVWMVGEFNEESNVEWTGASDDGVDLFGNGWGKAYDIGRSRMMTELTPGSGMFFNVGGDGVYDVLARYATGTADWENPEGKWRIRFHGDGRWSEHMGMTTYPDDITPRLHEQAGRELRTGGHCPCGWRCRGAGFPSNRPAG